MRERSDGTHLGGEFRAELWQELFSIELNHALLVRLAAVNVRNGDAAIEQFLNRLEMEIGVGPYRPVSVDLLERKLRLCAFLDLLRVANVVVALNALGPKRHSSAAFSASLLSPMIRIARPVQASGPDSCLRRGLRLRRQG